MNEEGRQATCPTQITGRVSGEERRHFETHARKFGLDAAGLLALLLAREMRVDRLADLLGRHARTEAGLDSKVTTRIRDQALLAGLRERAVREQVSVSKACAVLVRAELEEGWLDAAIRL